MDALLIHMHPPSNLAGSLIVLFKKSELPLLVLYFYPQSTKDPSHFVILRATKSTFTYFIFPFFAQQSHPVQDCLS